MNPNISEYFIWRGKKDKPQHKYELVIDEMYKFEDELVTTDVQGKIQREFYLEICSLKRSQVVWFLKTHYQYATKSVDPKDWLYFVYRLLHTDSFPRFINQDDIIHEKAWEWISNEVDKYPITLKPNMAVLEKCFEFNLEIRPNIRDKVPKSKEKLNAHLDPYWFTTEIFTYREIEDSFQGILSGYDLTTIMDSMVYLVNYFMFDEDTEEYIAKEVTKHIPNPSVPDHETNKQTSKRKKDSLEESERKHIIHHYRFHQLLKKYGGKFLDRSIIEFKINPGGEAEKPYVCRITDEILNSAIVLALEEELEAEIYEEFKEHFKVIDQIRSQRGSLSKFHARELGVSLFNLLKIMLIDPDIGNKHKVNAKMVRTFIGVFYSLIELEDILTKSEFQSTNTTSDLKDYHRYLADCVIGIEGKVKNKSTPFVVL